MPDTRRSFIKKLASFLIYTVTSAAGLLKTADSLAAWRSEDFAETKINETMKRLFGGQPISESEKIKLKLPRIAENGALVPVTVTSSLNNVESITILVEKNPVPLAAVFKLTPEAEANVSARLKMAETCLVYAIVKAEGDLYSASKQVKVTIGGCGG